MQPHGKLVAPLLSPTRVWIMFEPLTGSGGDNSAAYAALAAESNIEVREKASLIEAATALLGQEIEMANKYKVLKGDGRTQIFYAVEQSDCCTRQLAQVAPDCAPFNVDILYVGDGAQQKAFQMEKPCSCTFLCCNRPTVNILDANTGAKIGSIKDPCHCCNDDFTIRDADDNDILQVSSGCCQIGKFCPFPCGPCAVMEFSVLDASGGDAGKVVKKIPGCCKFFLAPDVDNYKIDFGKVDKPEHKALMMALSIFIDFRLFNDNSNDKSDPPPEE